MAIAYDFDGTLALGNIQENSFIPAIKMSKAAFWQQNKARAEKHEADGVLSYMTFMLERAAAEDVPVRRQDFAAGLREKRDPTLVRHIYDLHMTRDQYDPAQTVALAHELMKADAQERGDKFPAWKKNPLGETLRAVFVDGYADFLRDMVYGEKPDFETAVKTLNVLADHIKKLPS